MLRLLSIRNFVVVEALDLELGPGFSVLTGETGAGKSILLDALGLLLGDRFETRQIRPGAERAELAAAFDATPTLAAWLDEQGFEGEDDTLLLRRVLDAQGRSRAWINGRPATLAQLGEAGARLVELHGQHAHQALLQAEAQRSLLDAFAGAAPLAAQVADAWRTWREAVERRDAAAKARVAGDAERASLATRVHDLATLAVTVDELEALAQQQSRLAHAATLLETATFAEDALTEGEDALARRLAAVLARLNAGLAHDPALAAIVALVEPARIQLTEAGRELRTYRQRLDLDPGELARVEERLASIHDMARRHRVRPEALPGLLEASQARLGTLEAEGDDARLAAAAAAAESTWRELAGRLSAARAEAAATLGQRVTEAMQTLAMKGGRFEIGLVPLAAPASHGAEQVAFRIASHPKQPLGPLARVASGGELSRVALAIQVATSEVGEVPTLVFDEVDAGIGGTVAATVGALMQALGARRQVLCVTHLPQVAAFADRHFRVVKDGADETVRTDVSPLGAGERVEEVARMLAGSAITAKTRAHAREMLDQHRRGGA